MTRLVELSAEAPGRPVTRARLAEKDALPPGFLDDILRSLRTGGLVRSQRGGGGGWSLARPAASITVAHVIRAVEGPLSVVRGVRPRELPAEGDPEPFVSLWIAVRASLRSVLEAVTIADLAAGTLPPGSRRWRPTPRRGTPTGRADERRRVTDTLTAMADDSAGALDRMLDAARRRISMLDPAQAAALRDRGAVLVDTRPVAQRHAQGTIPGAVVVDRNVLEWRVDPTSAYRDERIAPDRPVVVFCQQGYASSLAVAALVDIGVADVHDLRGGFDAWRAAGLPIDDTEAAALAVEPLTGTLGAEVHGVDLTAVTDGTVAALRDAWLRHRVLFVRDQHLTPAQLAAFGRHLGDLTAAPPVDGTGSGPRWVTDGSCSVRPPMGAVVAAVEVPDRGGDTLWADLVDAYRTLSEPMRRLLDPLIAVHDAPEPVRHPVVRVHPETGEQALFVNPVFTRRIEGLGPSESARVLELLFAHLAAPERTVRWRWRAGESPGGTTG